MLTFRQDFLDMYHSTQILLVTGGMGCGKTTQIPQFVLYDELPSPASQIVCTEPRPVSAKSTAIRIAEEMDVEIGEEVGYKTPFEESIGSKTLLKYTTDKLLLYEAIMDPLLSNYMCIILDHAEERTIATDVLIGLLKDTVPST
jgi:pre-mRNA-splicing factor ATP-dependent RNA helicase DHX15/PRP43